MLRTDPNEKFRGILSGMLSEVFGAPEGEVRPEGPEGAAGAGDRNHTGLSTTLSAFQGVQNISARAIAFDDLIPLLFREMHRLGESGVLVGPKRNNLLMCARYIVLISGAICSGWWRDFPRGTGEYSHAREIYYADLWRGVVARFSKGDWGVESVRNVQGGAPAATPLSAGKLNHAKEN